MFQSLQPVNMLPYMVGAYGGEIILDYWSRTNAIKGALIGSIQEGQRLGRRCEDGNRDRRGKKIVLFWL